MQQEHALGLRRSSSAASQRPVMDAHEGYDHWQRGGPVDPYDRLQEAGGKVPARRPDPFDLFANMFGGGGGASDMFDGNRTRRQSLSGGARGGAPDPFEALSSMFGGAGGSGDMFGMSPEGADDPFAQMMQGLNMNGEGGPKGKGGFAHYKRKLSDSPSPELS